jgi:hypothetical protein
LLASPVEAAAAGIFDVHVHLWNGEESLRTYEEQLKRDDGIIALASTNTRLLPIATVHPYDGLAAIAELERVAAKGVKVLKLHPHTQNSVLQTRARSRSFGRRGSLALSSCSTMPASSLVDCEKLFNLALNAAETTFIFAHLGGMNFRFWNILKAARTAKVCSPTASISISGRL